MVHDVPGGTIGTHSHHILVSLVNLMMKTCLWYLVPLSMKIKQENYPRKDVKFRVSTSFWSVRLHEDRSNTLPTEDVRLIIMRAWFHHRHVILLATIHTAIHLIKSSICIPPTSPSPYGLPSFLHPSLYHLGIIHILPFASSTQDALYLTDQWINKVL